MSHYSRMASKIRKQISTVDLPVDVWAKIASHLSLKQWAKASCLCRTTRAVRLKTLSISSGVPPAGLSLSGDSSQKVAVAVVQGSQSITELQKLCIETSSIHDPGCLPWLLSKATRVRVLVATVYARQWLPSLESLTHLVLELPGREVGNVCSAFSKAKALQTLCLSNSLAQHQERGATPVNLDMPPSLKVLALKGICPDKLSIPKSCCLHLGRIPNLDLKQAKWASLLSKVRDLRLQIGQSSSTGAISKDCVIPATNKCVGSDLADGVTQ